MNWSRILIFLHHSLVQVLMFWIVDSLLMRKQTKQNKPVPSKNKAKYNKLKTTGDSGSESDECDVIYTSMNPHSTTVTAQPSKNKSDHPINMSLLSSADRR